MENARAKKKKKAAPPPPQQDPQQHLHHDEQIQHPQQQQQQPLQQEQLEKEQQPVPSQKRPKRLQQQQQQEQQDPHQQQQHKHDDNPSPPLMEENKKKQFKSKLKAPTNDSKSVDKKKVKNQTEDASSIKSKDKNQESKVWKGLRNPLVKLELSKTSKSTKEESADAESQNPLAKKSKSRNEENVTAETQNPLAKLESSKKSKSRNEENVTAESQNPLVPKGEKKPKLENIIDEGLQNHTDNQMPSFSMSKKVIGKIELPKDQVILEDTNNAPDEEELIDNYDLFSMDSPPEDLTKTIAEPVEKETIKKIEIKETKKKPPRLEKKKSQALILEKEATDKEIWTKLLSSQQESESMVPPQQTKAKPLPKPTRKQKELYETKPSIQIDNRARAVKAPDTDMKGAAKSEQLRKNLKIGSDEFEPEKEERKNVVVELDIDFGEDLLPTSSDYIELDENLPSITTLGGLYQGEEKQNWGQLDIEEKMNIQDLKITKTDESYASVYFG